MPSRSCKKCSFPLDLLLYLIQKNKINIYDIPIVEITNQYLEYIRAMEREDMNVMSEFLVMAATLLDIKARMLLPKEVDEETGEVIEKAQIPPVSRYSRNKFDTDVPIDAEMSPEEEEDEFAETPEQMRQRINDATYKEVMRRSKETKSKSELAAEKGLALGGFQLVFAVLFQPFLCLCG